MSPGPSPDNMPSSSSDATASPYEKPSAPQSTLSSPLGRQRSKASHRRSWLGRSAPAPSLPPHPRTPITFTVVDPSATTGRFRSASQPSPYVEMAEPALIVQHILDGDVGVLPRPYIVVRMWGPLLTKGPFDIEVFPRGIGGELTNEPFFTRRTLVMGVSHMLWGVYNEENSKSRPNWRAIMRKGEVRRPLTTGKFG